MTIAEGSMEGRVRMVTGCNYGISKVEEEAARLI